MSIAYNQLNQQRHEYHIRVYCRKGREGKRKKGETVNGRGDCKTKRGGERERIVNGVKDGKTVNGRKERKTVNGGKELQRKGKESREKRGRAVVRSEDREEDANEEEEGKDRRVTCRNHSHHQPPHRTKLRNYVDQRDRERHPTGLQHMCHRRRLTPGTASYSTNAFIITEPV